MRGHVCPLLAGFGYRKNRRFSSSARNRMGQWAGGLTKGNGGVQRNKNKNKSNNEDIVGALCLSCKVSRQKFTVERVPEVVGEVSLGAEILWWVDRFDVAPFLTL
jgi:hypothetical protein